MLQRRHFLGRLGFFVSGLVGAESFQSGRVLFANPAQEVREKGERPPFVLPENVAVHSNLVYSKTGNREVVGDLYLPKQGAGPFPAIIFVHGSGLPKRDSIGATKDAFRRQAALLAARGFVGLTIDYRFRNEVHFPGCIYDAKAAVRWLRVNAQQYRIDPDKIVAAGGSWGGYIVSMLAVTHDLPEFEGDGSHLGVSSQIQAAVLLGCNPEPLGHGRERRAARGPESFAGFVGATHEENPGLWAKASPFTHICEHCPPFLMMHNTDGNPQGYANAQALMWKLRVASVHAEFFTVESGGHEFYQKPTWFAPSLKRLEEFLAKYLK